MSFSHSQIYNSYPKYSVWGGDPSHQQGRSLAKDCDFLHCESYILAMKALQDQVLALQKELLSQQALQNGKSLQHQAERLTEKASVSKLDDELKS